MNGLSEDAYSLFVDSMPQGNHGWGREEINKLALVATQHYAGMKEISGRQSEVARKVMRYLRSLKMY